MTIKNYFKVKSCSRLKIQDFSLKESQQWSRNDQTVFTLKSSKFRTGSSSINNIWKEREIEVTAFVSFSYYRFHFTTWYYFISYLFKVIVHIDSFPFAQFFHFFMHSLWHFSSINHSIQVPIVQTLMIQSINQVLPLCI